LIKPDLDEKIQEDLPTFPGWAEQNADNCDVIDGLFRKSEGTWTVNWTGSVSNPAVGAGGFTEGRYVWLTPHLIFGYYKINFGGAGLVAGSGVYGINLPVTPDPSLDSVGDGMPIGKGVYFDFSAVATTTNFVTVYNPDTGGVYFSPPTGGAISATSPFAAGQGDGISGYFWIPV
jgi:hypothetical protein